jgi:hypothetical protein
MMQAYFQAANPAVSDVFVVPFHRGTHLMVATVTAYRQKTSSDFNMNSSLFLYVTRFIGLLKIDHVFCKPVCFMVSPQSSLQ